MNIGMNIYIHFRSLTLQEFKEEFKENFYRDTGAHIV